MDCDTIKQLDLISGKYKSKLKENLRLIIIIIIITLITIKTFLYLRNLILYLLDLFLKRGKILFDLLKELELELVLSDIAPDPISNINPTVNTRKKTIATENPNKL